MITVKVRLFGALRKYGDGNSVTFESDHSLDLEGVRAGLARALSKQHPTFSDEALIGDSAFADEHEILADDAIVDRSCTLAALPPVCGG